MTTQTDDAWIDELIVELRLRHVTGPDIGDAVASARELLADSGQSAEEAFGPARTYAASLEFPTAKNRDWALPGIWLPLLGLIAFLGFTQASTAWFERATVQLSAAQVALLAIPLVLALTLPLYLAVGIRHRWVFIPLIVVASAAGALSAVVAPSSEAEAWIVGSPLPLLIVTAIAMVLLSIIGTAMSIRSRETDEIVEPLPGAGGPSARRGWHTSLLLVNWLFPIFSAVIFALNWALTR